MAEIKMVGVVGAGQMGSGIAQVSIMSGYKTLLWDISPEAVGKAQKNIDFQLKRMVEKGKLAADQATQMLSNLRGGSLLQDFKEYDLVIEAATENVDLKIKLFKDLDNMVKPGAYLCSNTSSISLTKIAAATKRPDKVMGVHFMNPPPLMKLVEMIRAMQTSQQTYDDLTAWVTKLGKTPVDAKDSPGFTVNRILAPMINEAVFLHQEGVNPKAIDDAMVLGTNQPMGPLALADLIGLDTCLFILQVMQRELGEDKYRPCPLLVKYVEAGWLGKKTGKGFYTYTG